MEEIYATTHESELRFISNCVLDYSNLETGGDYFGFWTKYGMPVIVFATGPGPQTSRSEVSFYQDIGYLHNTGNYVYENYKIKHIGSWHSHHRLGLEHPSGGDVNTMRNALSNGNLQRFFITICNIKDADTVKINGFLFSNEYSNFYRPVKWNIIERPSPIREKEINNSLFTSPKSQNATFVVDVVKKKIVNVSEHEKPALPENSFFNTKEGSEFLKKEFLKIKNHPECSDVEMVQNEDNTIGFTFKMESKDVEIRYPNDFSSANPNPIVIERENGGAVKTHNIESNKEKKHFIKPFDLIKEMRKMLFGFIIDHK